ncbi:MAG: tRNA (adenosine(37)-N6)-threonylcarbamoyltransferase complex dimerization subunit type 1 TsaB [Bacteroidota bacterium]
MSKKKQQKKAAPPPLRPLILALETATAVSSVALFEGPRLLGHLEYHANKLHAKLITVMVDRLLRDLELKPADLAAIAVAKGPGSYTGLRVGVSTAKGLCMALEKPLMSVGSLEAIALSISDFAQALDARICPMIDARRMEVFCALYDAQGYEIRPPEAKIIEDGAFAADLEAGKVIFAGDGAAKCRELLADHPNAVFLDQRLSTAAGLGPRLWEDFQNGVEENLVTFEPYYLKDFVATKSTKKIL